MNLRQLASTCFSYQIRLWPEFNIAPYIRSRVMASSNWVSLWWILWMNSSHRVSRTDSWQKVIRNLLQKNYDHCVPLSAVPAHVTAIIWYHVILDSRDIYTSSLSIFNSNTLTEIWCRRCRACNLSPIVHRWWPQIWSVWWLVQQIDQSWWSDPKSIARQRMLVC